VPEVFEHDPGEALAADGGGEDALTGEDAVADEPELGMVGGEGLGADVAVRRQAGHAGWTADGALAAPHEALPGAR
jgi:hypothetical protein